MSTESFEVVEISSGSHEGALWVSVGFSSPLEHLDVLHFVCSLSVEDQDRILGHNAMYLERFDQAYSCYAGADSILVERAGLLLSLNAEGCEALALSPNVAFSVAPHLKGWEEAILVFKQMQELECGRVLIAA